MKSTIEQQLLNSKPDSMGSSTFVENTMRAVHAISESETFRRSFRKKNTTKRKAFFMKIRTAPGLSLLIATSLVICGSAYAAVNWFNTETSVRQKADLVVVSAKDCPAPMQQAITEGYMQSIYSLSNSWQIVNPSAINAQQIEQAQLVSCEQNAITAIAHQRTPDIFFGQSSHSKQLPTAHGLYPAFGNYGTVSAITKDSVTIRDIPAHYLDQSWTRLTQTFVLRDDTIFLVNGQSVPHDNLQIGDQVYMLFQNLSRSALPLPSSTAIPTSNAVLRVLSKTQYDYHSLDVMQEAIHNGALKLHASEAPIGG